MSERLKGGDQRPRRQPRRNIGEPTQSNPAENTMTPEARTEALFALDVADLHRAMQDRIVGLAGTPKLVRLDTVVPYSKTPQEGEREIGHNYLRGKEGVSIEGLPAGTLWAFPLPHRKMKEGGNVKQSLVAAKDHNEKPGACVQVVRSSKYNPASGEFERMQREGDMAAHFELENNETATLQFLDDSEILYIVKGANREVVDIPKPESKSETANQYLRGIVSK